MFPAVDRETGEGGGISRQPLSFKKPLKQVQKLFKCEGISAVEAFFWKLSLR